MPDVPDAPRKLTAINRPLSLRTLPHRYPLRILSPTSGTALTYIPSSVLLPSRGFHTIPVPRG